MKKVVNAEATKDFLKKMLIDSINKPYSTIIAHKPIFYSETKNDFVDDELYKKKIVLYPLNANVDNDDEFYFIKGSGTDIDDVVRTNLENEATMNGVDDVVSYINENFYFEKEYLAKKQLKDKIRYDGENFENFNKLMDYLIDKAEKKELAETKKNIESYINDNFGR